MSPHASSTVVPNLICLSKGQYPRCHNAHTILPREEHHTRSQAAWRHSGKYLRLRSAGSELGFATDALRMTLPFALVTEDLALCFVK